MLSSPNSSIFWTWCGALVFLSASCPHLLHLTCKHGLIYDPLSLPSLADEALTPDEHELIKPLPRKRKSSMAREMMAQDHTPVRTMAQDHTPVRMINVRDLERRYHSSKRFKCHLILSTLPRGQVMQESEAPLSFAWFNHDSASLCQALLSAPKPNGRTPGHPLPPLSPPYLPCPKDSPSWRRGKGCSYPCLGRKRHPGIHRLHQQSHGLKSYG